MCVCVFQRNITVRTSVVYLVRRLREKRVAVRAPVTVNMTA